MQKLKGLLPIFNFIILISLLILGIYTLNKYKNLDTKISSLSVARSSQIAPLDDQTTSGKSVDGYFEYINSYQKVKLKYPQDWTKTEFDDRLFVEFKKDLYWDFNIFGESLTSNPSLEEYKLKALNIVKDYKNYRLIDSKEITLANLPAFSLTFLATFDKEYKIKQIYTVRQNHGFSLTYRSDPPHFDEKLNEAEKMFSSFEILTD